MENRFILCIETATEVCSVALSKSGISVGEKSVSDPNSHGTRLTLLIEDLLKENQLGIKDLAAVAYSSGPGSYTGLRIGLSVAKGICYGAGIPLIAIPTLQHMARASKAEFAFPMIDARRMEVYGALVDGNGNYLKEPFSCVVDSYSWEAILKDKKICFLGNGMAKSKSILQLFPNAIFQDDYTISAASLCEPAHAKFVQDEFEDLAYHVPFYLKEANVTVSKKKML